MSRAFPLRKKRNSGIRSFMNSCESVFDVMFDEDTGPSLPFQANLAANNDGSGQGCRDSDLYCGCRAQILSGQLVGVGIIFVSALFVKSEPRNTRKWQNTRKKKNE